MASFRITLYHEGADFSVRDRELVDMAVLGGEQHARRGAGELRRAASTP